MANSINATSTGAGGITTTGDDSGILQLQTNETTAITIDASQNVGIGITPNAWASNIALQMTGPSLWGSSGVSHLTTNTYFDGTNYKYIASNYVTDYYQLSGAHVWRTAASGTAGTNVSLSEAMRIDSSGNLLVGTTSVLGVGKQSLQYSGSSQWGIAINDSSSTSGSSFLQFQTGGTTRGNITNNANTGVLYNVTSDQRLKENIRDAETASNLIETLQVRQYDWKANGLHQRYGFIAQELLDVAPEAVYQPNDPEEMMAVDYSKLVPMLVKAHQEQQAQISSQAAVITTLTERITALEAK